MTRAAAILLLLFTVTITCSGATAAAANALPAKAPPSKAATAPQGQKIRTFLDCRGLPRERLRSSVSPKFYKQLTISPLDAWIHVRAPLHDNKAVRPRVLRSEAGGAYDELAVRLAENMQVTGTDRTETRIPVGSIDLHVLIYKIKDAVMAVGFWNVDDPRYSGYRQIGPAKIGFYQNGTWTFLPNPVRR
jgi:hypothetical protein